MAPPPIARFKHSSNSWALVTGASDGIGKSFVWELCRQGFNIILHGRNRSKLEIVEADLLKAYPLCETRLWIADASAASFSQEDLSAALEGVELTVLINNVGGCSPLSREYMTLSEHTPEEVDGLINMNLRFPTQLTRVVLPIFIKSGKPCLVMNIGSMAFLGAPYLDVYAGTKGYVMSWTRALSAEQKAEGSQVKVLGVLVGSVQSGSNKVSVSFANPSSATMAKAALASVGTSSAVVASYWAHRLQKILFSLLPERLAEKVWIDVIAPLKAEKDKAR